MAARGDGSGSCCASPRASRLTLIRTSRPGRSTPSSVSGSGEGVALEAIRQGHGGAASGSVGLHAHIGSQIFLLDGFRKAIGILVELIGQANASLGFDCRYLNVGGGLGIRYTEEDTPSSIAEYAAVKVEGVREEMAAVGLPMPRVLIEPGRSIVGKAGITA